MFEAARSHTMSSRMPGFYSLSLEERKRVAAAALGIELAELEHCLEAGGLPIQKAEHAIENVIGTYALPFALGLNFQVNGVDRVLPMVVEEPSVVAAASNAAKLVRAGGGFHAEVDEGLMIAQVQLDGVPDVQVARARIEDAKVEIIALADSSVPNIIARGGGMRDLEIRDLGDGLLVVHLLVDTLDAMGANIVNTMAETVAPTLASLSGGRVGLRILSNLADRRLVRVRGRVPTSVLAVGEQSGEEVRDAIVRASRFAETDPYRAVTHNKGIMNGVDAVILATGNDFRAVEAGAHGYAARSGKYSPLCTFRVAEDGALEGRLEMPMALGVVGGMIRVHEGAQLALKIARVDSAKTLAMLAGAAGMASNLAALRALATLGIQRGHMALHARQVAIAAGARGHEVDRVAAAINLIGSVTLDEAKAELARIRS
ncbi:MAG: hydroxymethylglutaryl-CoA reductase, degradative [Myxococcales bacterium]|nr:hydroxymethylglutaryl-CoA reductase, degradative [Myxococcales bacterium]